jgi:hypothetical protein
LPKPFSLCARFAESEFWGFSSSVEGSRTDFSVSASRAARRFLDEGFAAESVAVQLRTAGFTVQRFHEWFKDENGRPLSNVPDPEVIRFCHKNGWLLVSRDHEMKNLHREEIRKSEVAILATANNKAVD